VRRPLALTLALAAFPTLLAQGPAGAQDPSAKPSPSGDPMGHYLSDLEKAGVLTDDGKPATLETLRAELVTAEDELVTGNAQSATTRLYRLVESNRYAKFNYAPEYANAELTLGRALVRAGAYSSAERYLLRALAHGPKSPFFGPAYRAMVDIALETREQKAILAMLDTAQNALGGQGNSDLPRDARAEHEYLAGKVAYEAGNLAEGESHFQSVDRQSRFFAAALYFRGLTHVRKGHFAAARASLCEIVEQVDQSRFTFFIDGRYYAIKDLAYLALGRIAHEQGKYDDSYYFYFRVPEDSERLPDALFEASWSMFQKQEYEAAGAFLEQFDRAFPKSPLAPDVLLLHAMIDLKSCQFDRVRTELEELVKVYKPIEAEVAGLLKEPGRRRILYKRLLSKQQIGPGAPADPMLELLKIDPKFYRYVADIVALDRESGLLPAQIAVWDELTAKQAGKPISEASENVQLVQDIEALQPIAKGDPEMEDRVGDLLTQARRASRLGNVGTGPFAQEAAADQALGAQARALRARLVDATSAIAEQALFDLDKRLREMLRQARLTQIDAVIGKKKKLEIEISNLREGRYPPDMFAQLQLEGLMGDDEEYWPFEGEYWSDEYENYK
jgi:tetratricopeptide (TPR) repeat protein